MNRAVSQDFGRLYKAALAEREPERKLLLLKQVNHLIFQGEQRQIEFVDTGGSSGRTVALVEK